MAESTDDYENLLDDEGIQAISYEKSERVLCVFVEEKLPEGELAEERLISNRVTNQETDVVEVGEIWAGDVYDPDVADVDAEDQATSRHRPPEGGRSEIRVGSTAATCGLLAEVVDFDRQALWHKDVEVGDTVRVSNAHVYGDSEDDLGAAIVQPSPRDGGMQPEDFVGETVGVVSITDRVIDAAVRTTGDDESFEVRGLGAIPGVYRGPAESLRGTEVTKSGRTTDVTTNGVIGTDATVRVRYGDGGTHEKRHCLIMDDMSSGGDSGSPLVRGTPDDPGTLVGHIFAGSDKVSVANRASLIEERLGVEFRVEAPDEAPEPPKEPPEPPDEPPKGPPDEPDPPRGPPDEVPRPPGGPGEGEEGGPYPMGAAAQDNARWHFSARLGAAGRVVDGDTLYVTAFLGFKIRRDVALRLAGVDTGEVHGTARDSEEFQRGQKHMQFVEDWLADAKAESDDEWPLRIWTLTGTSIYGRYTADVQRKSDDEWLVDALISEFGDEVKDER